MTLEAGSAGIDGLVERAGRWMASRTTRRSFLGKLGRGAVLLGSGPTMAALLADPADARVCGQSGVALKCPSFDCHDVWGWCWYATGCCANGGLKKICDCCAVAYPNVHGYCPSGTNVKCIVESCGADPRVMVASSYRLVSDDPTALSASVSSSRFGARSAPHATVVSSLFAHAAAIAAPVSQQLGGPLLVIPPEGPNGFGIAEIQRLDLKRATFVGPGLSAQAMRDFERYGVVVDRLFETDDLSALSMATATWLRARGASPRAFALDPRSSLELFASAGALASATGWPVLYGRAATETTANAGPGSPDTTYLVGPEAVAMGSGIRGTHPIGGIGNETVAANLAEVTGLTRSAAALAYTGLGRAVLALSGFAGHLFLHDAGTLGGRETRHQVVTHRETIRRLIAAGATGALTDDGYYMVQGIVNGFETHLLTGRAGQGLPVITQPVEERPVGRARVASQPAPEQDDPYWVSRGS